METGHLKSNFGTGWMSVLRCKILRNTEFLYAFLQSRIHSFHSRPSWVRVSDIFHSGSVTSTTWCSFTYIPWLVGFSVVPFPHLKVFHLELSKNVSFTLRDVVPWLTEIIYITTETHLRHIGTNVPLMVTNGITKTVQQTDLITSVLYCWYRRWCNSVLLVLGLPSNSQGIHIRWGWQMEQNMLWDAVWSYGIPQRPHKTR